MLTILAKIFKILNSEQSPSQISSAIALAVVVGFTPLLSLHNLVILFVVLFFRVNLTMFILAWPMFGLIGLALSPVSQSIGMSLLTAPALTDTWEAFYNTLIGRWSNFYHSGVIGGFVLGFTVALLSFPIFKVLVVRYRNEWMEKLEKFQLVRLLKASSFWHAYNK